MSPPLAAISLASFGCHCASSRSATAAPEVRFDVSGIDRIAFKPVLESDKNPHSRPGHRSAALGERVPEMADSFRLQETASGQTSLAEPLLAERAERPAHPGVEGQGESLLRPVHDLARQKI